MSTTNLSATSPTPAASVQAHRGAILHYLDDPGSEARTDAYEYFADGLLLIADGHVQACGPADALLRRLPTDVPLQEHRGKLLIPGFIDTHIHYPQTDIIAADGDGLLDWLTRSAYPAERRFADAAHARATAEFFLDELLRNGTTTALVFGSVQRTSVDAFFAAAAARRLRMIAGKVLMDRNVPADLRDTAASGIGDSEALLQTWHRRDRLAYAITPRFAPTSSPEQLAAAGRLAATYPDAYIHSHLAENRDELAWVAELFPDAESYCAVYDRHGLLRERAVYAHCLHLGDGDRRRMAAAGAVAAFCPTSNLYLGSGLFDSAAADRSGLHYTLATDVGGGSSFSLLRTAATAYEVAQLQAQHLTALRAFYLLTLGNARGLQLQQHIGSFQQGREADFLVLNPAATPLLARRSASCRTLNEQLQVLMMLGDDRVIEQTYVLGTPCSLR